ncbi:MAG: ZIP family metal transporter [bacterium JZ-2024 1]
MNTPFHILGWILFATFLGSLASLFLASLILLFPHVTANRILHPLVGFASGSLLGVSLLHLLPETLEHIPAEHAGLLLILGFLLAFFIEKRVLWHHCHSDECEFTGMAGPLVLIGDAFHNFVDGFFIAASFFISPPVGISTTIAVFSHEIPQELGDLALILDWQKEKRKAFLLNLLSGLSAFAGAISGFLFLQALRFFLYILLSLSISFFLYISLTDIFPRMHQRVGLLSTFVQLFYILSGVAVILLLRTLAPGH